MCWHCDQPVGTRALIDPFLIEVDEPAAARVCAMCHAQPELALTVYYHGNLAFVDGVPASLGRTVGGDTYYRLVDLQRQHDAVHARKAAAQAAEHAEAQRRDEEHSARLAAMIAHREEVVRSSVAAALSHDDATAFHAFRARFRGRPAMHSQIERTISRIERTNSPYVTDVREVVRLGRQFDAIRADVEHRLIGVDGSQGTDLVETALLGQGSRRAEAWVDEIATASATDDSAPLERLLTYLRSGPRHKPCGHGRPCSNTPSPTCKFVRRVFEPLCGG